MCPHKNMSRKPGIMSWDLYKKIIDEIAKENPNSRVWMTFFGEGLMLNDLDKRIAYAKSKGLKDVVLNSNGNLLNEKWSKRLIKAGLDIMYVGIDAFKKNTYERIRIKGNLDNVIKGVIGYKKLLDKIGNKNQKIFVQFVEMPENEKELESFIDFWNTQNIPVKVRPKVSWAGKVTAENLKNYEFRLPCNWAMNTINISDQGKVCMCAVDLNCEVSFGDVNKSSIKEIWNTTLKEFRLKHLKGRWSELPAMCRNCNDWQSSYASYVEPGGDVNEKNL